MSDVKIVTATAPVNIAVIKYWGKRDEKLILPINDSISATLSSDQMHAKTTVAISPNFAEDKIWLNGKEESMDNPRLMNCLREVRKRAELQKKSSMERFSNCKVHICSENNFPTAAGLASSAAGYACLVYALCKLFDIDGDISELARQGSGSACRSVLGGFVRWHSGVKPDGGDSIASVVQPASHWPDLKVLILVATDERKKVPSSIGMKRSVETSKLLKHRADQIVPTRCAEMEKAIEARNFERFAKLTMEDSNQLHAVCLDTYPPCVYMNETSHAVVNMVHRINERYGTQVCYTFDAGPNACLFLPQANLPRVASLIQHFFPSDNGENFFRGEPLGSIDNVKPGDLLDGVVVQPKGKLKYVIATRVGEGPQILEQSSQSLLSPDGQEPRSTTS